MTNNFEFKADLPAKKIYVTREFNAPIESVWKAFTLPELLDKWMGPSPYKVVTRDMDFTIGGAWLYAMVSPEGQKHWVYNKFTTIENSSAISSTGMFCDGDGNPMLDGPKSYRDTKFLSVEGNKTKVEMIITFDEESTIKWFVEGGFKEGTAMTFDQLDKLLAAE
ncbi:MAG TPA: SRPBCC domain-containing protein [Mucilaginibacter sp.]|jgi:uncharacterized protein YndB with AHSA1/START domain|nr:SRPBCC domain-containing protein [Mucilaginibacter sp.]